MNTFSPLMARSVPSHGKSNPRGTAINRVIVHHWAGTVGGDTRLMDPNVDASVNYFIYNDGTIVGQVPEERRAWTSGGFAIDAPSITIEIQNESNGGQWPISNKAYISLLHLISDIAKRYGWGGVRANNVRGHQEFVSTACPGPYVFSRMSDIVAKSDAMARGGSVVPPVKPPTTGKSISQLADEVLQGLHGNGADRERSLGANFAAVQTEVNRRILGTPAGSGKSISQLADEVIAGLHGTGQDRINRLGSQYNAVQAEVNRKLGVAAPPKAPGSVDINRLATATIRGDFGNGDVRRAHLGANYDAVMAEVNRRLL